MKIHEQRAEQCGATRRRGMTLVELLVAISLLVIMMASFSVVLSQSRKAVAASEATLRGNAAAMILGGVIRMNIEQMSKSGFCCITQASAGATPQLLFTTAGPAHSVFAAGDGNGAVSMYGVCGNAIWRKNVILLATGSGTDILAADLGSYEILPRYSGAVTVNSTVSSLISSQPPSSLVSPPVTLTDINNLWQLLSANCTSWNVYWTDGTDDLTATLDTITGKHPLLWAGIEWNGSSATVKPYSAGWTGITAPGFSDIEFSVSGAYRALWTWQNQSNWPKAIKIRFQLSDPSLPADYATLPYEVICPVGR